MLVVSFITIMLLYAYCLGIEDAKQTTIEISSIQQFNNKQTTSMKDK